ncbi:MAG: hypothetical protein ACI4WX_01595 [Aristaeellaceae bacterium]
MIQVSPDSVRQWALRALDVLVTSIPMNDRDMERMNRLCREVDILLLDTDCYDLNHVVADAKGCYCGFVRIVRRNCFMDIPPLVTGGQLLFPRPLLALCPHDGGWIHPVTLFHEIAHLLSCGSYTEEGENQYTHVCGLKTFTYMAADGKLLVTGQKGLSSHHEVMTDMTAKMILEGLSFDSIPFSAYRQLRMECMEKHLLQHGFSREKVIQHYLEDRVTAKKDLNQALERFVLT